MNSKNVITLIVLISLTISTALISIFTHIVYLILGLFVLKVLLVAFQFMELKKAHAIWKVMFSGMVLMIVTILAVLNF